MAPTERLTLGLLGGLGDAIGEHPEAEQPLYLHRRPRELVR